VLEKVKAKSSAAQDESRRRQLQTELERAQQLFVHRDWSEGQYLREKARIERESGALRPTSTIDIDQAAAYLQTFRHLLDRATPHEQKLLFHSVFDQVYIKQKKVVAIRPKPNYYDLLRMSRADPTGFEPALSALTGPHVRPLHHGSNIGAPGLYHKLPRASMFHRLTAVRTASTAESTSSAVTQAWVTSRKRRLPSQSTTTPRSRTRSANSSGSSPASGARLK
jgi:hypothetical protein